MTSLSDMTLRAMLGEMGTPSIPSTLPISHVHKAFDEQGEALETAYIARAERFLKELEWYATALKNAREHCCQRAACEQAGGA